MDRGASWPDDERLPAAIHFWSQPQVPRLSMPESRERRQYQVLAVMVLVWFLLGCIIDSISILLITVPVFAPIAVDLGFHPLAVAILGILPVETGLLTPPFGILVFTVKAALPDEPMSVGDIFRGSIAYWFALIAVIVIIAVFPGIATYLPTLGH